MFNLLMLLVGVTVQFYHRMTSCFYEVLLVLRVLVGRYWQQSLLHNHCIIIHTYVMLKTSRWLDEAPLEFRSLDTFLQCPPEHLLCSASSRFEKFDPLK